MRGKLFVLLSGLAVDAKTVVDLECVSVTPIGTNVPWNSTLITASLTNATVTLQINEIYDDDTKAPATSMEGYHLYFSETQATYLLNPDHSITYYDYKNWEYPTTVQKGEMIGLDMPPDCSFVFDQLSYSDFLFLGAWETNYRPEQLALCDKEVEYYVDEDGDEIHLKDDAKEGNAPSDNWYKVHNGTAAKLTAEPDDFLKNQKFVEAEQKYVANSTVLAKVAAVWGPNFSVYPSASNSSWIWVYDPTLVDPRPFVNATGAYTYGLAAVVPRNDVTAAPKQVDANKFEALIMSMSEVCVPQLHSIPSTVAPSGASASTLGLLVLISSLFLM